MLYEVFYEPAYRVWVEREHPSADLEYRVIGGLAEIGARSDFHRFCVAYNDQLEHYETKVPGTAVFAEFFVYEQVKAIDVVEIATGSSFL